MHRRSANGFGSELYCAPSTTAGDIVVVGHADELVDFSTVLFRQLDVMPEGWRLMLTIWRILTMASMTLVLLIAPVEPRHDVS